MGLRWSSRGFSLTLLVPSLSLSRREKDVGKPKSQSYLQRDGS